MRRTRREFLEKPETQQAASPELRSLAQQYLLARRQNTRDTIGRVAQGAVMGAAGMAPPERQMVDSDALRADILAQLAEQRRSRSRTEAERMAGLADIAAARAEKDTALLDALQKVMSSAAAPAGGVARERIGALSQRASDIHDAIQRTRLTPGERARVLRATEGLDPDFPADVGTALSQVAAGMPDKADQVVAEFFSSAGMGRRLGNRDPMEYAVEVEAAGTPEVQDLFQQASNLNSGGAYAAGVREAAALAEEAQRIGVPGMRQAAEQLLSVARGAGALPDGTPGGAVQAEDRITEAVLNPDALPPDDVEMLLMEQLQAMGQAPENLPEFRTKLMATPAFNEFVQQAGYEDSPFGRKQAFKDILTMQKMQAQESRRGQYQGYDREADEKGLGTSRSVPVDLEGLPDGAPRPEAPRTTPAAPQQPAAASVVGGAQVAGSAAPRREPEAQPVPARPAIVPAEELSAAQEESPAPIRASQPQKNAAPKLDIAIDAYQRDRFGRPVSEQELIQMQGETGAVDAAIDAYQTGRFGRPMGEGELLRMGAPRVGGPVDYGRMARELLQGIGSRPTGGWGAWRPGGASTEADVPTDSPPESEQEPLDYGESQTSARQRRQRDLVAALLKRRVA